MLAGGTYNSPTVLMRSGIGPADNLGTLGIPVAVDLPGVGRNLHDHPAVYVVHSGSESLKEQMADWAVSNFLPEEQTIAKLRSRFCTEAFDLHIYPESGPYAEDRTTWDFTLPVACMNAGGTRLAAAAIDRSDGHAGHRPQLPRRSGWA